MTTKTCWTSAALALSLLLPLGCVTDGETPGDDGEGPQAGKGDVPVSDDQLINTSNNTLELLFGWDYLHDATTANRCVESQSDDARGRDVKVGERQGTFDLQFVSERSELASELGLDLAMQATYSGVGVNSKMNMLNKFSKTNTSLNYLVKIRREYTVRHRHALQLNEVGGSALENGIDKFLDVCGTHYARGMRYGAELYVMITYTAADESLANELKAELGVDAGDRIPGADVNTSMAAKLSRTAKKSGVNVSVSVSAQGFVVDREQVDSSMISQLLGEGVTEAMFTSMDQLYAAMQDSVEGDVCRDTGLDECWPTSEKAAAGCGGEGQEPCGYYYNNARSSIANGIAASLYTSAPNWNSELDDEMEGAMQRVQDNEDYMRSLGELLERMSEVYINEIKPFRKASQSAKAAYNVPVGTTAKLDADDDGSIPSSVADLVAVNDVWEYEFLPSSLAGASSQVGVSYERVEKEFKDCYQGTAINLLETCGPGNVDVLLESDLWKESEGMLDLYNETGRILPVNYKFDRDALVYYSWAVSRCEETNFGTQSAPIWGRLPTKEEAQYLAPLVGFGSLDWSGADARHRIWFKGSEDDGCDGGKARVLARDPSADDMAFECLGVDFWGNEILPVCVPAHGPIAAPHRP